MTLNSLHNFQTFQQLTPTYNLEKDFVHEEELEACKPASVPVRYLAHATPWQQQASAPPEV